MFEGAKVLVAGGTGFVGVNLIRRLLDEGARVRATLHRRSTVLSDPRIEYVRCDLLSSHDCHRVVEGMDYVFMCAASTSGAAVIAATPLVHVTPNIVMNAQMLEAAYLARVKKFIWLSSSVAYPPKGACPMREKELFDGDPYDAYFAAGWMKRYTEILCRLYSEKLRDPLATVVVRPSNIYGPYDDFDFATSHVTAALIRKVVERHDPIEIWGTGEDVRDLIYIDDFIDGLMMATTNVESYDPVNIAFGKGYRIRELLEIILEADGHRDARVRYDPTKPSMIPVLLVDTGKAERMLGFRAKVDLPEGVRRTIAWYRQAYAAGWQPAPEL